MLFTNYKSVPTIAILLACVVNIETAYTECAMEPLTFSGSITVVVVF